MPGHGGCLDEDAGVYKRRDRAEVGLGKWEYLSHCWGGGDEEERMSAGMGWRVVRDGSVGGSCQWGKETEILRVPSSFVARLGFRPRIPTTDLRLITPLLHQPRHRPTYQGL